MFAMNSLNFMSMFQLHYFKFTTLHLNINIKIYINIFICFVHFFYIIHIILAIHMLPIPRIGMIG